MEDIVLEGAGQLYKKKPTGSHRCDCPRYIVCAMVLSRSDRSSPLYIIAPNMFLSSPLLGATVFQLILHRSVGLTIQLYSIQYHVMTHYVIVYYIVLLMICYDMWLPSGACCAGGWCDSAAFPASRRFYCYYYYYYYYCFLLLLLSFARLKHLSYEGDCCSMCSDICRRHCLHD